MTVSPALAARIIAGARTGRLLLMIDEVREMLNHVPADLEVIVDSTPVRVCDIPITVLDDLDPLPHLRLDDERDRHDAWRAQLAASLTDDLIDADDVERLWHQPPPAW